MNPQISIVIPVYQVERYIKRCIISLSYQTFDDFEVILVDDGTMDRSIEVAEQTLSSCCIKYAILRQKNKGVSAARNEGIRSAKGQWVICIDPDDFVAKDFLNVLYNDALSHNVDVAIGNFRIITTKQLAGVRCKVIPGVFKTQAELLMGFLTRETRIIAPTILFRREFIIDNSLWYNETMRFTEDLHFIWRVLLRVRGCSYNSTPLYYYCVRQGSTMTSSDSERILTGYNGILQLVSSLSMNEISPHVLDFILPRWVLGALRTASRTMQYSDFRELAHQMNSAFHMRLLREFPDFRVRILASLLLVNPRAFYFLNHYMRSV